MSYYLNQFKALRAEVRRVANPSKAKQYQRFFKTGPGQYGQGDKFVGISVPNCRKIAKNHEEMSMKETELLLQSKVHEERIIALVLLINRFKKGSKSQKRQIHELYVHQMKWVNNWNLVDISAPLIIGEYFLKQSQIGKGKKEKQLKIDVLYKWCQDPCLWYRRISIVATFAFIRANKFEPTLKISQRLLGDKQDLIHKAVGWMLREVGKRDTSLLQSFLQEHYQNMPRTTLRYAIEKFDEQKRKSYLSGNFNNVSDE